MWKPHKKHCGGYGQACEKPYEKTMCKPCANHLENTWKPGGGHVQTMCKPCAQHMKPCGGHVETTCKPCGGKTRWGHVRPCANHVETTWKPCGGHVETTWKTLWGTWASIKTMWKNMWKNHVQTMCKPFGKHMKTRWGTCANHVQTMCKPCAKHVESTWNHVGAMWKPHEKGHVQTVCNPCANHVYMKIIWGQCPGGPKSEIPRSNQGFQMNTKTWSSKNASCRGDIICYKNVFYTCIIYMFSIPSIQSIHPIHPKIVQTMCKPYGNHIKTSGGHVETT